MTILITDGAFSGSNGYDNVTGLGDPDSSVYVVEIHNAEHGYDVYTGTFATRADALSFLKIIYPSLTTYSR